MRGLSLRCCTGGTGKAPCFAAEERGLRAKALSVSCSLLEKLLEFCGGQSQKLRVKSDGQECPSSMDERHGLGALAFGFAWTAEAAVATSVGKITAKALLFSSLFSAAFLESNSRRWRRPGALGCGRLRCGRRRKSGGRRFPESWREYRGRQLRRSRCHACTSAGAEAPAIAPKWRRPGRQRRNAGRRARAVRWLATQERCLRRWRVARAEATGQRSR